MPQSPKSNRGQPGRPARGNSGRTPNKNHDEMPNVCKQCNYYGGDHAPNCPRVRGNK